MASTTTVFEVHTECSIGGEDRAPGSIQITYSVNSYGQCTATHYSAANPQAHMSAISITSADVYTDMGSRQALIFSERKDPDYKVLLSSKPKGGQSEEKGGTIQFEGFIAAPSYNFNTSTVAMSDTGVDKLALLDVMNLSIYAAPQWSRTTTSVKLSKNDYCVPKYAAEVVKEIIQEKNLPRKPLGAGDDYDDKAVKSQHRLNVEVLPVFLQLMKDSEETWGWRDILAKAKDRCDASVAQHLMSSLCSASNSFISSLLTFATGYKNILVPESDEDGKITYRFCSAVDVVNRPADAIKVNPVSAAISAGNTSGLFPIRYVAVTRPAVKASRTETHKAGQIVAVYPVDNMRMGGTPVRDMGAPWMPEVYPTFTTDPAGKSNPIEEYPVRAKVRQEKSEVDKNIEEGITLGTEIDMEWAKLSYYWMALGTSTVTLSLPFTRTISVGRRYQVYSRKGDELFTGFCSRVTYRINTQGSRDAGITAEFTHVELPGFKLVR